MKSHASTLTVWRIFFCVSLLLSSLLATANSTAWRYEATESDDPMHPIQKEMKGYVEEMLEHAIDSYLTYAFPMDELNSLTGTGRDGMGGVWVTLIDALDTVALMNRPRLFRKLARWVEENVSFDRDVAVSAFETNIRALGGLLAAHFMYEEGIVPVVAEEHDYHGGLLTLATDLGNRLLRAFDTPTGIPYGSINLRTGVSPGETPISATAAGGTYLLEMTALSRVTGDVRYEAAARRASQAVFDLRSPRTDLLGNHLNTFTGSWPVSWASVGTGSDSTIEYWGKSHALSGEVSEWNSFSRLLTASRQFLHSGGLYLEKTMTDPAAIQAIPFHCSLASFYPGLLVRGGRMREAVPAAWSAHGLYRYLGALPERMLLNSPTNIIQGPYPLRPEHLESIYHLYRATGDPAYLKMGKEFAIALNLRTRTPYGFAKLRLAGFPHSRALMDDSMESFMISETLKYLYLLFDECNPVHMPTREHGGAEGPLSRKVCPQDAAVRARTSSRASLVGWEFTTEAHLFPNTVEWLVPVPATAARRVPPPGLEPSEELLSQVPDEPSLLGQAGARLGQLWGRAPARVLSKEAVDGPARLQLEAGETARLAPFVDGGRKTRAKVVHGLLQALVNEAQPLRNDNQVHRATWKDVDAAHAYFCENYPLNGLERLSKSVYREAADS